MITARLCLHKIGMVFFPGGIGLTLLLDPNIGTHALGETILGVDSLFVNTFQYASHAESTLVLLHVLVVIVQSANGKVARRSKILRARHHNTFASTASRGANSYLFAGLGYVQIHATRVLILKTASSLVHVYVVEKMCAIGVLTHIAVLSEQTIHVQLRDWVAIAVVVASCIVHVLGS